MLGYPDAVIERLNEEHGVLDLSRCREKPALGERVADPAQSRVRREQSAR